MLTTRPRSLAPVQPLFEERGAFAVPGDRLGTDPSFTFNTRTVFTDGVLSLCLATLPGTDRKSVV